MNYKLRVLAVKKLKGAMGISNSMAFRILKNMCNETLNFKGGM